jgi:hypothetical protein
VLQIPDFIDRSAVTRHLPVLVRRRMEQYVDHINALLAVQNPRVMARMAPSAVRGLFLRVGQRGRPIETPSRHRVYFDFDYPSDHPEMMALYEKAKRLQWNASTDLDWRTSVDPMNPEVPLLAESFIDWASLNERGVGLHGAQRTELLHRVTAWMLSQFLHGEQGALLAAAQVTEATHFFDGKFYGATQVMDEARHVEVFRRYLDEKLERRYVVNDNLFTIIDSLMTDGRWDMKFLGMQILVEGLALGAFSTMYKMTSEPLLRDLLKRVIQDEARHVRYGILALRDLYNHQLTERERAEREDWAFEIVVLMRNRFLAHELYEEGFAHLCSVREWNAVMNSSPGMSVFRTTMFKRLVPNLRAIGLLTDRVRPKYESIGLGRFIQLEATDSLTDEALLAA